MQNTDDYVQILLESLQKKKELLDRIIEKNHAQTECVKDKEFDDVDWDAFNLLIGEKEILIDRINEMDEGFQNLYDHVKLELNENKSKYSSQIKAIQELIKQVTDQSIEIQTTEERNRALIEKVMLGRKKVIKQMRNGLKVANSYIQTMQGGAYDDMNVLNKKK